MVRMASITEQLDNEMDTKIDLKNLEVEEVRMAEQAEQVLDINVGVPSQEVFDRWEFERLQNQDRYDRTRVLPNDEVIKPHKDEECINIIKNLMKTIDSLKEHIEKENEYLGSCDGLLVLFNKIKNLQEEKERLQQSASYRRIERRVIDNRSCPVLTDAQKIKAGYINCTRCDRLVLNMEHHQKRRICKTIYNSKKTTLISITTDVANKIKAQTLVEAFSIRHIRRVKQMNN